MTSRTRHLVALAVLSTAVLSGCAFIPSGPPMIDPDDIAETAEQALEDAYDVSFSVDCGNDDVELDEGENVDCVATERETDLEYDADVEITDVNGDRYEIEVELADEANNADDVVVDEPETPTDSVTVSGDDIATLAAGALSSVIGYEPTDMFCLSENVEIFVDNVEYCAFTGDDGEIYNVDVTITEYDEATGEYGIVAEIVE